jgi:hypothetical protein
VPPYSSTIEGRWVNDSGSVLTLTVHADGRLTGSLRLATDGSSYRPHRIVGSYTRRPDGSQGIVGSVVGWPTNTSITVWCAEHDSGADSLETSWLSSAPTRKAAPCAASIGGAVFRRVTTGARDKEFALSG